MLVVLLFKQACCAGCKSTSRQSPPTSNWLNQWCHFDILQDLKRFLLVANSLFLTGRPISSRGGTVKLWEEKGDLINELFNYKVFIEQSLAQLVLRSTTLFPLSKQTLHKSQFLEKLDCQKPYWDQARLSSLVAPGFARVCY